VGVLKGTTAKREVSKLIRFLSYGKEWGDGRKSYRVYHITIPQKQVQIGCERIIPNLWCEVNRHAVRKRVPVQNERKKIKIKKTSGKTLGDG